jgi:hypothetical protein
MTETQMLHVRLIEGSICIAPVAARENLDGTFRIQENPDFDPEDTSTLFEFLPGDDVRAERCALKTFQGGKVLVAKELVRSSVDDRDCWTVLFAIAWGDAGVEGLDTGSLSSIARRIRSEIDAGTRWHYPAVVEWAGAAQ